NGKTGWPVIEALITGLQIEEGITSTTGTFGPATMAKCPTLSTKSDSSNEKTRNQIMILQGALYCKGYNPTGFTGTYGDGTKAAIKKFQTDA
ncbi:peptidoglycan-binding domain-containing protein, partial [Bacillus amyloliquefaciens]